MTRRLSDLWPFLGGGIAAFAAIPLGAGTEGRNDAEVIVAVVLFVGVVAAAFAPWERLPRVAAAVPVAAAFAVIALLRDAEGGTISGYSPLVLLPVFWLALHGTRREVLASFAAVAALFVVPILADHARYPNVEWRRALLWLIVTPIVGLTTHTLVGRVRESARVDALTGLPNRLAWGERLALELAQSERNHLPLSVAMLDLDDFKAYNDTHGHLAGDELLSHAASGWRDAIRDVDLLARLGGDEFALLLPHATRDDALRVVERARAAAPRAPFSAGVVEWDRHEDGRRLLGRADSALYRDKAERSAPR